LSVALSTVRAVLDPDRRLDPEHYVAVGQNTIALERGSVVVDLEGFLREAEAALAMVRRVDGQEAVPRLKGAEAAYAGDFLEEDPYEDWAIAPREHARALYLSVERALLRLAAARDDHEAAARHALHLLERDPYDETAHLALVAARTAARAHGEARRAYLAYRARMAEIDIRPAPFPAASPGLT